MQKNTDKKLKIAFLIDDGLDKPDGVQQYILALGRWFEEKGHSVSYLTGETKREDIKNMSVLSKNLKVRFNGNTLSTPFPPRPRKVKELLKKEAYDILHVQMPYSPFMAAQAIHFAPKATKIIGTFHVLPVGKLQYLGTKLLGYSLKVNLKKFDKFISVSAPARDFAKKSFGINSQILPNPVDISKFNRPYIKRGRSLNIVFLGRLVPRKGCMVLLRAVNELIENDNSLRIKLHICGEGNQRHKLERYAKSNKLKNITKFYGFIDENSKADMLNFADFTVFPSVSGESFGIVLIEAMAANTGVVLAGNNPGYASVFSGLEECLFDPSDPHELRLLLHRLINKQDEFDVVHEKQQQHVKRFDVNFVGSKLLNIYKNL